jgi:tetratricopeptide (TPR) repeat protein
MAYSVREERQSLAVSLREDIAKAERSIVQLRRDNVESFLQLLDGIEERFAQLESSGLDLRTELTRWVGLQSKLRREANRISRVLDLAGGLAQLRQDNPPAQGLWWHLDEVVAAARRSLIRRLGITTGTIVGILAIVWVLLTFVFPPDPNTVIASEAISTLHQLAFDGRWEDALAVIEGAKAQLTKPDAELLIWEGVIRDKLGQSDRATEALAEAKALVPAGKLVSYWWTVGSVWLSVVDVEKARSAANKAIAFDASDPQGYFLLASVAEVEGNTRCAIDLFDKTFQLASESNAQLAVIARVRMGNLLQRPANMSLLGGEGTDNGESGTGNSGGAAGPCNGE